MVHKTECLPLWYVKLTVKHSQLGSVDLQSDDTDIQGFLTPSCINYEYNAIE